MFILLKKIEKNAIINIYHVVSYWSFMRMKYNKRWKAFSLTELLIVVVVVAVLFSAMLPMMTKRRSGATSVDEPIWQFVNGSQRDAYYDRNMPTYSSTAFFGLESKERPVAERNGKYPSKVQIKANPLQNHLQFRYGTGNGTLTGLFVADNKGNILGTGKLRNRSGHNDNYNAVLADENNVYNTVLGNGAFARVESAIGSVAVGANASASKAGSNSISNNVVAVGFEANKYGKASESVVVGSGAGKTEDGVIQKSVVIGADSVGLPSSRANDSVLIGADTGTVGSFGGGNHVILGSNYIGNDASEGNTILGYGAFSNAKPEASPSYITAVGYASCATFGEKKNNKSAMNKTCIGATSGATYGPDNDTKGIGWDADQLEHIFLGGAPQLASVSGRAVLEVHNLPRTFTNGSSDSTTIRNNMPGNPKMTPTVVMNSNLVVRGNVYWPTSSDGVLRPHSLMIAGQSQETEQAVDPCYRNTGHSKKFHSIYRQSFWDSFVEGLGDLLGSIGLGFATDFISLPFGLVTGVVASVGAGVLETSALVGINMMSSTGYLDVIWGGTGGGTKRFKDPVTGNAVVSVYPNYDYSGSGASTSLHYYNACTNPAGDDFKNYPVAGKGCPDLKLGGTKNYTYSDLRLKENISENRDAIEKILLVMPYDYTFKADKTKTPQVGVIAQDLEEYFPNSVSEDKDGYLRIRLDEMFFASINTVKNLDKVVQNLESEISGLENQTQKVQNEKKATQKRISEMNKRLKKLEK